ncbi:u3 snoRNA associated domain-containing protein [Hirsutella rhossiliensis]|uniref:U3 snoRNA associated domain-containing protein n=1 Tax=Hirsutella rhossiliensis TaxID=111463 RepID=A0A9P8MXH5_9HYPO|nr:u3 snoRNA associated domain-containing protein [Hirsutella rhossiliensis]KAH0962994.1 u3 snoRNA associated domain-containing protein [Hirsutella rhossiliensis]
MVVQTRKRKAALEQSAGKTQEAASVEVSPKRQKLPMRSRADEPPAQKAAGKGTLITFDDDDNADQPVAAPAPAGETVVLGTAEQELSDESDDDAPEAVSTAQVASDMKKSAQATQRAAREQATAEKRKRQERDVLLKKQAEERKKAGQAAAAISHDSEDDAPSTKKREAAGRRKRTDRVQVPSLLPLEFLTDDSSSEDEADDSKISDRSAQPRQRKVEAVEKRLTRLDRGPQDERIGSTVYRVAAKLDERLAPKVKRYSLSARDRLLQRNRTAAKPRSSFFTKK